VEGELQSRSWKTEDGFNRNTIEIKARRIQFLNRREAHGDDTGVYENNHEHEHVDHHDLPPPDGEHPDALKTDGDYGFGYRGIKI
jgi:single-strand DNA-binding protein